MVQSIIQRQREVKERFLDAVERGYEFSSIEIFFLRNGVEKPILPFLGTIAGTKKIPGERASVKVEGDLIVSVLKNKVMIRFSDPEAFGEVQKNFDPETISVSKIMSLSYQFSLVTPVLNITSFFSFPSSLKRKR
ncbi:MAG: hypothetical protein PHC89_00360 [Candidatus Pacebacteria bacterium]|nr:hypothetical protein [Candidatus Paceibacterota bacterium]